MREMSAVSATPATGARLGPAEVVRSFDGPAGAYVHVPFCDWICPFCPYNKVRAESPCSTLLRGAPPRGRPVRRRVSNGQGRALHLAVYRRRPPTLYPDELADVIARIPVSGERAVEVLPNHGTPERLDALAGMGVTAVSIGAQSFHDGVLLRLGVPRRGGQPRRGRERARSVRVR